MRMDSAAAIRMMMDQLGVTLEDLDAAGSGAAGITVRDYAHSALEVLKQSNPGTHGTYRAGIVALVDGVPGTCACACDACRLRVPRTCPACAGRPRRCKDCRGSSACPCAGPDGEPGTCACGGAGCGERWRGLEGRTFREVDRNAVDLAGIYVQRRAARERQRRNNDRVDDGRVPLSHDGRGAFENYVRGVRWLWNRADTDALVGRNVAVTLTPHARAKPGPRDLTVEELQELFAIATTTGRDPHGDGLILWTVLETASRRGGLLSLTYGSLRQGHGHVDVYEPKVRESHAAAVTGELMAALVAHAAARGPRSAAPADAPEEVRRAGVPALRADSPVLYREPRDAFDDDGYLVSRAVRPVTRTSLDSMRGRLRRRLPWADDRSLRLHDFRHTTGKLLERVYGKAISQAQLGHGAKDANDMYTVPRIEEQRAAIGTLFGPG